MADEPQQTEPAPEPAPSAAEPAVDDAGMHEPEGLESVLAEALEMTQAQEGETGQAPKAEGEPGKPTGDGVTDDTQAVQAAIDASQTAAEPESRSEHWQKVLEAERDRRGESSAKRELETIRGQVAQLQQLAQNDPLKFAETFGLTLDKHLEAYAGQTEKDAATTKPAPEWQQVVDENRQLRERVDQIAQMLAAQVRQSSLTTQTQRIQQLADAKPDEFEIVRSRGDGGSQFVLEVAAALAKKQGIAAERIRSDAGLRDALYQAALEAAEQHYQEEETERIKSLRGLAKFKGLFAADAGNGQTAPPPNGQPAPTLGQSGGDTPVPSDDDENWSLEDTVREALRLSGQ